MTFARGVFLFAIVMLAIGAIGTNRLLSAAFSARVPPSKLSAAEVSTSTPRPTATPRPARPPTATPRPTATMAPTALPTLTPQPTSTAIPPTPTPHHFVRHTHPTRTHATTHHARTHSSARHTQTHSAVHHTRIHPTVHHVQTHPTTRHVHVARPRLMVHHVHRSQVHPAHRQRSPRPSPTPTPGIVTLVRYWVGETSTRPGETISIGYVIDNATGRTVHLMLGASLMSAHALNWATSAINDPYHDVVATVPPGVTTHVRYFTLPSRLPRGLYDVAWGLRNPANGERVALVDASGALRVSRIS